MLDHRLERALVLSLTLLFSLMMAVTLRAGPVYPDSGILPVLSDACRAEFPVSEARFLGLAAGGPRLFVVAPRPEPLTELASGDLVRGPAYSIAAPDPGVRVSLPAGPATAGFELVAYGDSPDAFTIALIPAPASMPAEAVVTPRGRFVGFASDVPIAQIHLILTSGIPPRLYRNTGAPGGRVAPFSNAPRDHSGLMILVGTGLILFWSVRRRALEPLPASAPPRTSLPPRATPNTREVGLSG